MQTKIYLPFPPSVNALFATNFKTKRRFKSKEYVEWIDHADAILIGQKAHRHKGAVNVEYRFHPPKTKHRRDVENYLKACGELLTRHQIITDDSQINILTARWDEPESNPVVRITIDDSNVVLPWGQK